MKEPSSKLRFKLIAIVVLFLGFASFTVTATFAAGPWNPQSNVPIIYTLEVLRHFNLVTFENYDSNQEVEGRTYIGGNLTGTSAQQFGIKLQDIMGGSVPTNEDTLVVMGNIVAGGGQLQIQYGSLYLGGELNGRTVLYNGGGSLLSNPQPPLATLMTNTTSASTQLSGVAANNSVTYPSGGQPGAVTFNVTQLNACGFAVFNVSAADVFNNSNVQQIGLNLNGNNPAGILINVSGGAMNWNGGNMVSEFTNANWRTKVLWNFYQAQTLNIQSKSFHGSALAPLADASSSGGVFEGSVVFESLTTTAEVHYYGFDPNISCLIPPTADISADLSGIRVNTGVRLEWMTTSEVSIVGFRVLRSNKKDGPYVALKENIKAAKSPGTLSGNTYKFKDKTALATQKYYYKLEIVTTSSPAYEGPLKIKRQ